VKSFVLVALTLLALACGGKKEDAAAAKPAAQPFDPNAFLVSTYQLSMADGEFSRMAEKRAKVPDTRTLGTQLAREHDQLCTAIRTVAQKRGIALPTTLEEKKIALRDNLTILPGQVFDRGYTLAIVQDHATLLRAFDRASSSSDAEVRTIAQQFRPMLVNEQKAANALLNRMGGSPFGFVPQ
jgi:predicted outer membrane protein